LCHNVFHLVDDRFVYLNAFYPLDLPSATRFFIFLTVNQGRLGDLCQDLGSIATPAAEVENFFALAVLACKFIRFFVFKEIEEVIKISPFVPIYSAFLILTYNLLVHFTMLLGSLG